MTGKAAPQATAVKPQAPAKKHGSLQRKCAGPSSGGGSAAVCDDCSKKKAPLQTKLAISTPGDSFELEADRVADQVLGSAGPSIMGGAPLNIQRHSGGASSASAEVPASVDRALAGPGQAMDPALRQDMQQRFGYDFSSVRIHTDPAAAQSAEEIGAHAYTVGSDIVFANNRYAPQSGAGRHLLAHELTHVVQQGLGSAPPGMPRIMRKACGHDGKDTKCGGVLGKIKFPGESLALDSVVVQKGLASTFPGKWLTEVASPPNPTKSGADGGRVDGIRVSEKGGLKVEVVEVKPRSLGSGLSSTPTGGCAQASMEAKGYVKVLQSIAPKVKVLSEKFQKIGGYRLLDKLTPKTKVERDVFATVGIDIDDEQWLQAWRFYNSIQQKWPKVFTKAFSSVDVSVFSEGDASQVYDAYGWLTKCGDGQNGIEVLSYMVNKDGGVSYGCRKDCKKKEEKKKDVAKPESRKEENKEPAKERIGTTVVTPHRNLVLVDLYPELKDWEPQFREGLSNKRVVTPPGTKYWIIAPKSFYIPMIAAPRMDRDLEHVRTHAMDPSRNPHLGLRSLGWTVIGLYAASMVVVLYAPIVVRLAGAAGSVPVGVTTAAPVTATTGGATGGVMLTMIGRYGMVAANDNAVKIAAAAAAALFVVANTSTANAGEVDSVDLVQVVEQSQVTAEGDIRAGTEVTYGSGKYHVIGVATTGGSP